MPLDAAQQRAAHQRIVQTLAVDVAAAPAQITAAMGLLDEGATVPFIARYRKEATGGLDDTQLRLLEERLGYLREMEDRRATVLDSIASQGKLDDALAAKLHAASTKAEIEDLYLPYKPKRRTRADIAKERGLEPLADALYQQRSMVPQEAALAYVRGEVTDAKAALEGARDILAERFAEDAELLGRLRQVLRDRGVVRAKVLEGKADAAAKFRDYFDHAEPWAKVAGHRALAMMRGRNEEFLSLDLEIDADDPSPIKPIEWMVADRHAINPKDGAASAWLMEVARWCWRVKLSLGLSADLMLELKSRAEAEAIEVFARNLKDLLLAAPAGAKTTLGLDPGIRTGVKAAVIDATGKLLETATLYPFQPKNDRMGALSELARLVRQHDVALIAIGNGTASRETEQLVADCLAALPDPKPRKVVVSEAGASVYSASALAAAEFPGLDVSLRGAVSIARRLQDPLAELVKIEPKSIGVGQYQHDVDQTRLARSLDAVVEDAVNAVGVDLNTASAPLLSRVSGLGASLAEGIVFYRDQHGAFASRDALRQVPRLGPKTFEQCAGFLRVSNGSEPLDASAVHPEAYPLARRIVAASGKDLKGLMGDASVLRKLDAARFADTQFGLPTVRDILRELEKPGRDPRPEFKTAQFADGIHEIKDLRPGMTLEGTVTNVAAFGAFVDIGVHQDGLVHVSQLADRYVKDPHQVVKAGQIVKVRVVEVDAARKRIALTMRSDAASAVSAPRHGEPRATTNGPRPAAPQQRPGGGHRTPTHSSQKPVAPQGALGTALMDALKGKR